MEETIKCSCVCTGATPVVDKGLQDALKGVGKAMEDTLNQFSDEVPNAEPTKEQKAKNILNQFAEYIKGDSFKRDVNVVAREMNVPPKKLATNFFEQVLGTIGDIAGIAVSTVGNVAHNLTDLLAKVMHCGIDIICNVANALVSMCTLNKTCVAR
jgi:hypothetical protein